jgi:hypothetical protein
MIILADRVITLVWGEHPIAIEARSEVICKRYQEFFLTMWSQALIYDLQSKEDITKSSTTTLKEEATGGVTNFLTKDEEDLKAESNIPTPFGDYPLLYSVLEVLKDSIVIKDIAIVDNELSIEYIIIRDTNKNIVHKEMLIRIADIMKRVIPVITPEINTISIASLMNLADTSGNTSLKEVSLAGFNRAIWTKISNNDFLNDNISTLSDNFWVNPLLSG